MLGNPLRVCVPAALVCMLATTACGESGGPPDTVPRPEGGSFSTEIHVPDRLRGLETELEDPNGNPITVSCGTCHESRDQPLVTDVAELDDFHGGLRVDHGWLECASCHDAEQRDMLHLASGQTLPMTDVMSLCAQCHGPQFRDYQHGSHGGMTGYWDLTQGPRQRNNCVDCHDPHAPQFPVFQPMPGPRDRIAPASHGTGGH